MAKSFKTLFLCLIMYKAEILVFEHTHVFDR